jgi:hypothetical protein
MQLYHYSTFAHANFIATMDGVARYIDEQARCLNNSGNAHYLFFQSVLRFDYRTALLDSISGRFSRQDKTNKPLAHEYNTKLIRPINCGNWCIHFSPEFVDIFATYWVLNRYKGN